MALISAATTAGAATRARRPYTYVKLSDLQPGNIAVNVMGVAVIFKPPYQSKGRDHTCTVEVVDEGCETSPVPLIFFNRDPARLPQSVSVGDVLCVRRVEVGQFNNRLQGKCRAYASWLVWDCQQQARGGGGEGGRPTVTSEGASWEAQEVARARQLLDWSSSVRNNSRQHSVPQSPSAAPIARSPLRASSTLLPIVDITRTEHKIRIVAVLKSASSPEKSRGPDYYISLALIDETSPSDGLPFTLFAPVERQLPRLKDPGCVIYMTGVKITEYEGALLGCGHEWSRVMCFDSPIDDGGNMEVPSDVRERVNFLLEWVATARPALVTVEDSQLPPDESQPQTNSLLHTSPPDNATTSQTTSEHEFSPPTFLTVMFHPTWPMSNLTEVLGSKILTCYRLRVKVLYVMLPQELDDCCQQRCPQCKQPFPISGEDDSGRVCEECSAESTEPVSPRLMYCLSVLVGDSTGLTSPAHLTDTDADEFFHDLPPANLREDHRSRQSLLKALTKLCGGRDPFVVPHEEPSALMADRTRPWINCCIQSYPSCRGTQLRIVDTWFVNNDYPLS